MNDEQNISRRSFIAVGAGAVAANLLGPLGTNSALAKPPTKKSAKASGLKQRQNILFIFTDQERYFPHRPARLSMPGHDRLIRQGVSFDSHYVSASMCTSSRSVMLTGLQTADNGMFDNVDCPYIQSLSPEIPSVGHLLRKTGYHTAYLGKWHLGREFGGHEPDKSLIARMEEYGFGDFFSPGDGMAHTLGGFHSDDMIAASAISWLRGKGRVLSNDKKPWSLFVSLVNPHDIMYFNADAPGENSQDTGKLLMKAARAPQSDVYKASWHYPTPSTLKQAFDEAGRPRAHGEYSKAWGYALGNIPATPAHWDRFYNFYLNSIRQVDLRLNAILAELDSLGMTENTVIVFTADHGEMGGNHGLRGKGPFAYEEAIHVPFHVIHPDVSGGQKCNALTSHIDIVPTLLSLAGAKKEEVSQQAGRELPGKDFSAALSNPKGAGVNAVRDSVLFTYSGIATNDSEMIRLIADAKSQGLDPKAAVKAVGYRPNLKNRGTLRAVFDGRYKMARYFAPTEHNKPATLDALYQNNDVELYDLKTDPRETKNLAVDRKKNETLIAAMNEKLEKVIQTEIGRDDGREMPDLPGVKWELEQVDL